jgi:membrane-bound metal-dependent hydrolase YbcI (DUF457 family)
MDPVSHLALGRALALASRGTRDVDAALDAGTARRNRRVMAACLLGALAPDIDLVLMPSGWDRYLAGHEYLTHSAAGTLAAAALTALVIALVSRSARDLVRLTLWAWAAAAIGHAALDIVSGGTVRPFWPVSGTRWTLPLVAMADPILAAPLWLYLGSSFLVRRRARALARLALVASLALLAVKAVSLGAASRVVAREAGVRPPVTFDARWGSFAGWSAFDRVDDAVRAWEVDAWHGRVALRTERHGPRGAPEARLSRSLETVRNFETVYDLGFPRITRDGPRVTVLWSDIRVCTDHDCAIWFGGTFDAGLRPLEQIVIVGTFRQTRAP